MMNKLMFDLCRQAKQDLKDEKKRSNKVINLDYADSICNNLFEHRKNEALQSRIRFKIQDLIDAYNKQWRHVISESKNRVFDNEGFKQIYVPKDQILTNDQVFHPGSSRKDKGGKKREGSQSKGYYYKAKSPPKEEPKPEKKPSTMQSLLKGL